MKFTNKKRTGTLLRAAACLLMVVLLFVFLSAERDMIPPREPERREPVPSRSEPVSLRLLDESAMAVLFCAMAQLPDGGETPAMLMLAVVDAQGTFTGISLPPQTRVLINELDANGESVSATYATLADAYTRGVAGGKGFENLTASVSRLFGGVPVNGCVALGERGVGQLVDSLGGLFVRYDHFSAVSGGVVGGGESMVRLSGEKITSYAGSFNRDVDTGALARQQEVFLAICAMLSAQEAISYDELLEITQPWFWSNLSDTDVGRLTDAMFVDPIFEMEVLWGENRIIDNIPYRLPDKETIKEFVLERFYPEGGA